MNLEEIEQKCLNYLMQVRDPLVPVDTLLRFLQRNDEFQTLTERELVEFLGEHELFKVVEPLPFSDDPAAAQQLREAGFVPRPRVMLATRVPTAGQVKEGMLQELERLLEALTTALYTARDRCDRDRLKAIQQTIRRAKQLRERLEAFDE